MDGLIIYQRIKHMPNINRLDKTKLKNIGAETKFENIGAARIAKKQIRREIGYFYNRKIQNFISNYSLHTAEFFNPINSTTLAIT